MLLSRWIVVLATGAAVLCSSPAFAKDDARDALWAAVRNGDLKAIEAALDKGADVNASDGIWYMTPLSQSVANLEAVKLLVKAGAKDIDAAFLNAASTGTLP